MRPCPKLAQSRICRADSPNSTSGNSRLQGQLFKWKIMKIDSKAGLKVCNDEIEKTIPQIVLSDNPGSSRNRSAKARAIAPIVRMRLNDTPG